jgi:hypothetical protein
VRVFVLLEWGLVLWWEGDGGDGSHFLNLGLFFFFVLEDVLSDVLFPERQRIRHVQE